MKEETLNSINSVITPIIFGLGCIIATLVFIETRFKLDPSMIVLAAIFLVSFFLRLPFIASIDKGENPFFAMATILIFAMLYFFVFEMRRLRDMSSGSLNENV